MRARKSRAVLSSAGLAPSDPSVGAGEVSGDDDEDDDEDGDDEVGDDGEAVAVGRLSS